MKKKGSILAVCIAAVMLIPMLYSTIYLSAFWDTYGRFNQVPIAFVNLDKPIIKDGKEYNIGEQVQEDLKKNNKVKWCFTNYQDAKKGVDGTKYYAMVVIPQSFSEKIAESKQGKLNQLEIIYEANKGRNYVFSQASQRAAESIKGEIASNIQKEITKTLVENLYDIKSSIGDASSGAKNLQQGTEKLVDGSGKLSKGLGKAAVGSNKLQNGLKQAANGEKQISKGASSLVKGLNQLKKSITQKNDSPAKLARGAYTLAKGANLLHKKAYQANTQLSHGLNKAANGVKQVSDNVNQADSLLAAAVANYKANGAFSQKDIKNIMTAQAIMEGIKRKDIIDTIAVPLKSSANAMKPLVDKLADFQVGAQQLANGTSKLADGITASQHKAEAGVNQIIAGAVKLQDGNIHVLNGLNTAVGKTQELTDGLSELNRGAVNLNSGLNDANQGSFKLKEGLEQGYNQINDKLKFTSNDMSEFVSKPVTLNDTTIHDVKYYGEGLAPYFISLSLWLGGMFVNLLLSITKRLNIIQNKFINSFIGSFIFGAVITIIQALLVSVSLIKGLHIDTVNTTYFYLNNMFISVVFFSVMYGVSYAIGIVGTPIMFIIFLLQLASSGGTFPIETTPKFFRIISLYFPMTYSVSILRMIISGINSAVFKNYLDILLGFMVVFLIGGIIIKIALIILKRCKNGTAAAKVLPNSSEISAYNESGK